MNNLNIPLYRAEVKDSKINREDIEIFTELIDGKRYAIGLLCTKGRQIEVTKGDTTTFINIDNSTLAINFNDMLDSQGNKIFASLSENGKGGDIIEWTIFSSDTQQQRIKGTPYYSGHSVFKITNRMEMMWHSLAPHRKSKVIGIQK